MEEDKKKDPGFLPVADIEAAIETGNFNSLTDNKFLKIDDQQALGVVKDLFAQIKRANPKLNEFSFSILTLFSAVMEVWGLTQDREKFKQFEIDQLPKDLKLAQKELAHAQKELVFIQKITDIKKAQYAHLLNGPGDFEKLNNQIEAINELNHQEALELRAEAKIAAIEKSIDSMNVSIQLKHYNLSSRGSIYTNMTTNLLGKYERIGKLMDQFKVNPGNIGLNSAGEIKTQTTASSGFTILSGLGADKKRKPN